MKGRRTCLWKFLLSNDVRHAQESLRAIEKHFEQWHKTQEGFKHIGSGWSKLGEEKIVQVRVIYQQKKESWHFKFVGSQIPHLQATVLIDDRGSYRETQWPNPELSTELLRSQTCDMIVPYPGKQEQGYTAFMYLRYRVMSTPALGSLYEQPTRMQKSAVTSFLNKAQPEFKAHGRELSAVAISQRKMREFASDCEADLSKWWGRDVLDEELSNCGLRSQTESKPVGSR